MTAKVYDPNEIIWCQHRYLSCSQWGWFDVTDLPWCCQIEHTDTIWGYYPQGEYDGTY